MNNSTATLSAQGNAPIIIDALEYNIHLIFLIVAFYIFLHLTSGKMVDRVFSYADIDEDTGNEDTGAAIGKVENVLILTLIIVEAYTALGVIFAAKSIVRKGDMGSEDSSYYLTGTITNFTYSVVIGVSLHVILWQIIRANF